MVNVVTHISKLKEVADMTNKTTNLCFLIQQHQEKTEEKAGPASEISFQINHVVSVVFNFSSFYFSSLAD